MKEQCFWDDPSYQRGEALRGEDSAEFLIVGAGVAGLFTAHFLIKYGVKPSHIAILERAEIGSGSTGHSAGMLISHIETGIWADVLRTHGRSNAALYYQAHKDAILEVARLIEHEHIHCDFKHGDFFVAANDEQGRSRIISEFGIHTKLGSDYCQILEGEDFRKEINTDMFIMAERMEKGISLDPLKFVRGIGEYLRHKGVRIYEGTQLVRVRGQHAQTANGTIAFKNIIYAQGSAEMNTKLRNFITSLAVTPPLSHELLERLHMLDYDMFIDTESESYHYARITADHRLIVGFGDEPTHLQHMPIPAHAAHMKNIQTFVHRFLGEHIPLEYGWSGIYSLSKRILPHVEFSSGRAVIAGMGLQITSIVVADHIAAMLVRGEHQLRPLFKEKFSIFSKFMGQF